MMNFKSLNMFIQNLNKYNEPDWMLLFVPCSYCNLEVTNFFFSLYLAPQKVQVSLKRMWHRNSLNLLKYEFYKISKNFVTRWVFLRVICQWSINPNSKNWWVFENAFWTYQPFFNLMFFGNSRKKNVTFKVFPIWNIKSQHFLR